MKRTRYIWLLLLVMSCLSCDKLEQALSSAVAIEDSEPVEFKVGTYVGTANEYSKVGGNGYDSTVTNIFYPDTFLVRQANDDQITFIRLEDHQDKRRAGLKAYREWTYDIVSDHIYSQHSGRSNDLFDLSFQDSMYIQFWRAGGVGAGASTRYDRFEGKLLK